MSKVIDLENKNNENDDLEDLVDTLEQASQLREVAIRFRNVAIFFVWYAFVHCVVLAKIGITVSGGWLTLLSLCVCAIETKIITAILDGVISAIGTWKRNRKFKEEN